MDYGELDEGSVQFHRGLLFSLLTEPTEAVVRETFSRIAPLPHLKKLRDALLFFIKHYVAEDLTEQGSGGEGDQTLVKQRIKMVEHAFRAPDQLR